MTHHDLARDVSAELTTLQDHYVAAVNAAVADDDLARAEALVADYDREAAPLLERLTATSAA